MYWAEGCEEDEPKEGGGYEGFVASMAMSLMLSAGLWTMCHKCGVAIGHKRNMGADPLLSPEAMYS